MIITNDAVCTHTHSCPTTKTRASTASDSHTVHSVERKIYKYCNVHYLNTGVLN